MHKQRNGQTVYSTARRSERILIHGGRVVDPEAGIDETRNVLIDKGTIRDVLPEVPSDFNPSRIIDAAGKWVTPGLVDMHVHLREPGREDRETIETGTRAASAGGFTAVACMANTNPVLDEESKIRYVLQRGQLCTCRVYPIGSITKGLQGEELSPFGEMVRAGARGVSDDGFSVRSSSMMRHALNYSKSFGIPVICHCEDSELTRGGHMNESTMSTRLGLRGMPSIAEEIVVARDTMLAEYTGARIHIAHVSTAGSVEIIRKAKQRGVRVTCESCPHYFTLTDEMLAGYDTRFKMNPPLRTPRDRAAVIEGLVDGTIDVIACDHAPHVSEDKKDVEFEAASFGIIGLETSLGLVLTELVHSGTLSPSEMVRKMCVTPNRILGLGGGTLSKGAVADMTIIDPDAEWTVDPDSFFSKSRNTPFGGRSLRGHASCTILEGSVVYERNPG